MLRTDIMSFNLGFIGGGNMSTALGRGIINNGIHPASKIWVSGPHIKNLIHWSEMGANITDKNGEVFCNCDVIFLGVKPSLLSTAVTDTLNTLTKSVSCKDVVFISMLAGITISSLREALQDLSKNIAVIRILPNMPCTVGAGCCVYSIDSIVTPQQCSMLENLLGKCSLVEKIPEYLMDSLGSLVGCGPAYIYIVIEALADGAVKQGVPRSTAQRMAAQMVMGSGQMVLSSGKNPGLLKDEVCSPGGTTICGIAALEEGNLRSTFIKAIEASTKKSQELGKKS